LKWVCNGVRGAEEGCEAFSVCRRINCRQKKKKSYWSSLMV